MRQDYKFSKYLRGKSNHQHHEWNNKKLKDCPNNNRY